LKRCSPRRIGRNYRKVLSQQIALARDELTGQGLYQQRKAEGDRSQELEQQIETWKELLQKLTGKAQ
jgi:hypothetical protein